MATSSMTSEISARISNHMNSDHKDSLFAYATYYGGIERPTEVKMERITDTAMYLVVDKKTIEINFDHILKDSKDAHETLVKLVKDIPKKVD